MTYPLCGLKKIVFPKFGLRSQLEMLLFTSSSQFCLPAILKEYKYR